MSIEYDNTLAPNTRIWRYTNWTKFFSLITQKHLFFPKASLFDDKYEGAMENFYAYLGESQDELRNLRTSIDALKKRTAISCWHMNDYESAAMWKLYTNYNDGIAIQSTIHKLCVSLTFPDNLQVRIGKVEYVPSANTTAARFSAGGFLGEPPDDLGFFFRKRMSFEWEKEVRMAFRMPPQPPENGIAIPVQLDTLIEGIYVAPVSQPLPGVIETVRQLTKAYGVDPDKVKQSPLENGPLY